MAKRDVRKQIQSGMQKHMSKEKDTYPMKVRCGNCGYPFEVRIPKGQTIVDIPCPHCGNCTLRKSENIML